MALSDVIIAGAGPAGTLAATILARAGARVRLFDRARFPRAKLCGDTLNPGAMRVLETQMSTRAIERRALELDGMLLTGPRVEVIGTYPRGLHARAIARRDLDVLLLEHAVAAGVQFQDEVLVSLPITDETSGAVKGIVVSRDKRRESYHAPIVIAADGRQSRLARAVGLAYQAKRPRRWAIGGYFEGVEQLTGRGEMHVRSRYYIGVAPLPGGLANACLVLPQHQQGAAWKDPAALLIDTIRRDVRLADRFAHARLVDGPHVLGPMAVDAHAPGVPGLLLAGDAAGFIDPITGDGIHFALMGARLAADVAGEVLEGKIDSIRAVASLARRRRQTFAAKWRFNRAIRSIVARPMAITAAASGARLLPSAFEAIIRYAGDCD